MHIQDPQGNDLVEVTLRLDPEEITDLLVAASQIEDGSKSHGMLRDPAGNTVAIYKESSEASPLDRGSDWWVGPMILVAGLLMVVGAFTLARGLLELIF